MVPPSQLPLSDMCAPLNLGFLASYIRKKNPSVDVKIFDGIAKQNIKGLLLEFKPDIIGVTATTPQAPDAFLLLDWAKIHLPACFLVMGGIHPSVLPGEAAEHADCVVIGEGEIALSEIIEKRRKGQSVPKIVEGTPVEQLDEIPSPAYDLIEMEKYIQNAPSFPGIKTPILTLVASRGCPHRCPFCWNSSRTAKVRYFSAQRIVDEILFAKKKYGINSAWFADDEFLINKKRINEMCFLFKKYRISDWLTWGCQARAKSIDLATLKTIKSMGCLVVSVGFESASPRILNFLKCGTTTVSDYERALSLAKKAGLTMGGSFIFGTPGESLAEMRATLNWCENEANLKFFAFNTLIPYPGTAVWKLCRWKKLLPENVDYTRLIPTGTPKKTYIVNKGVCPEVFNTLVVDAGRIAWIYSETRQNKSLKNFCRLSAHPTWWWLWLYHPLKMLRIFSRMTMMKHDV